MSRFAARLMAFMVLLWLPVMPASAQPGGPLVLAAASLQEALNAAADGWARKGHPRPVISFAGSSALARQIEQGAPADLFISADEQWMDYVANKRLVKPNTRVSFLFNTTPFVVGAVAWGNNREGELGDSTTTNRSSAPGASLRCGSGVRE